MRLGKAARGSSRTVSAIPGQGSLQELIRKAEGFLRIPLTFELCSHLTHPVRPAGKAVLFCHQMPSLEFNGSGLTQAHR